MNLYPVRAIYMAEMARTRRTLLQSIVSPGYFNLALLLWCSARPSVRVLSVRLMGSVIALLSCPG